MQAKPNCVYYEILQYQMESLQLLHQHFEVTKLPDPSHDTLKILAEAEVIFAPLGYQVDRQKIDCAPKLKVVASNTTGHPHIDVDYCFAKGISVACLKFAPEFLREITPTAELTFGLIIATTRNLVPAHESVLNGNWNRRPFGAPGMLSRMSIGIVGLGRLGSLVARYAAAFGMEVRYFDPFVESAEYRRADSLIELATASQIVSIHAPHESETEGLISSSVIEAMPRGGYLVNTARGELIDWHALLAALQSGHIAGVGLDVFENEFAPDFDKSFTDHPFLEYARRNDNVVLTPHIGGSTIDAWRETEAETIRMAIAAHDQQSANIG